MATKKKGKKHKEQRTKNKESQVIGGWLLDQAAVLPQLRSPAPPVVLAGRFSPPKNRGPAAHERN